MRVIIHNPAFLADDELVEQFVLRTSELTRVLRVIRHNTGNANEHLLILAPRGYGKTTLVRRVAIAVRRDPTLTEGWFPVVFAEESYEVQSAAEFWLEALLHLADATGDDRWHRAWEETRRLRDEERVCARALACLRTFAEERNIRLLLIVENVDKLLGEQLGEADAAAIRKVLQGERRIMLLATAVSRFAGVDQPDEPMFQLFRREELLPLTAVEIDALWGRVASSPLGVRRAEAVRVLTGGNPRLVILMASFAEGRSLRVLLEDLSGLIDRHTDYFKDNIEALEGQNRRVFLALANLWRPSAVKAIAEEARMDPNPTSVVLGRLVDQGRVDVVRIHGKNKIYQVSERLYNIYYLMRRRGGAEARVRALVDFMAHYYDPEKVPEVVARIASEACADDSVGAEGMAILGMWLARGDASTRAEILRHLPGGVWDHPDRPAALAEVAEDPATLVALLQGKDGEKWIRRAVAKLQAMGDEGGADGLALARAIVAVGPLTDVSLVAVATTLALEGGGQEASRAIADSIAGQGERAKALVVLTLAFLVHRDVSLACEAAEELTALTDGGPLAPIAAVFQAYVHGCVPAERRAAIEQLTMLMHQFPSWHWAGRFLAETLEKNGRMEEAVELYTRALQAYPDDGTLVERRFQAALRLADPEVAVGLAKEDLARRGESEPTLYRYALALAVAGKPDEVLPLAKAATRQDRQSGRTAGLVAFTLGALNRPTEAISAAERYVRLDPHRMESWEFLGRFAPGRILPLLQRLPKKSRSPAVDAAAATALLQHGDQAQAASAIPLVDLTLDDTPARRTLLARLHGRTGQPAQALALLLPLLTDPTWVRANLTSAQRDSMRLAAAGQGRPLLAALKEALSAPALEPIIVALQRRDGEIVDAPQEVAEVAQDIARRVEALAANGDIWRTDPLTMTLSEPPGASGS